MNCVASVNRYTVPIGVLYRAAFSEGAAERKIWGALLSLIASKDQVGRVWDNWLSDRLKRHSKTDSSIELRVVRLAADGV
jgi:tetracycline repressor-like protein